MLTGRFRYLYSCASGRHGPLRVHACRVQIFYFYIAKTGSGTRQRCTLPVSMCNFSPSRQSNLLLLISHNKDNINIKSLRGCSADITHISHTQQHYCRLGGRREIGTIWLVPPIPGYKLELDEWVRRAGCSGEPLPSLPSLFVDSCADRTGRMVPHETQEREFNGHFPSFPITPEKIGLNYIWTKW